jgi:hypothetical protein
MNELRVPLEKYFNRIANLQGTLLHIEKALTDYSKIFRQRYDKSKDTYKDKVPDFALGLRLIISDLTGETDNGWDFYFPTDGKHIVTATNYDSEIDNLIKRETGFSLAQGFEAFSTFLKDILASYFMIKPYEGIRFNIIDERVDIKEIDWGDAIRDFKSGKNNKNLFKLIRKINSDFEYSERNNNKQIDFKDWYTVYSLFRHKMVHESGKLLKTDKDFRNFNSEQMRYLESYFPFLESEDKLIFNIKRKVGDISLKLLSEYAFLIFKELSITLGYDWKILKNMK